MLVLFFGIAFAVLNANIVTINYYFAKSNLPLSLLLIITLFLGFLLGLLCSFIRRISAKLRQRQSREATKNESAD
jgi:putative membrane protein